MRRGLGSICWLALFFALVISFGCMTIHEEVQPLRETTLTVARSAGDVTLSWVGVRGVYYTVMYADAMGGGARWKILPDAINIPAMVSGEPIIVHDRVEPNRPRYYRLTQDRKPLLP